MVFQHFDPTAECAWLGAAVGRHCSAVHPGLGADLVLISNQNFVPQRAALCAMRRLAWLRVGKGLLAPQRPGARCFEHS